MSAMVDSSNIGTENITGGLKPNKESFVRQLEELRDEVMASPLFYKRNRKSSGRKVSFSDEWNLELEEVFDIETEYKCTISTHKKFVPKFKMKPYDTIRKELEEKMVRVYSLEVAKDGSIQGKVFVKTETNDSNKENGLKDIDLDDDEMANGGKNKLYKKINPFNLLKRKKKPTIKPQNQNTSTPQSSTASGQQTQQQPVEVVYAMWSVDSFKTWHTNEAKLAWRNKGSCIYEFTLDNGDNVNIGEELQMIVCYQMGTIVYEDTNDDKYFSYDCINKKDL